MDNCDQITVFINNNLDVLVDLAKKSFELGAEHGAKLCKLNNRITTTEIIKGTAYAVDLRHLKCEPPSYVTGDIYSHIYEDEKSYDSDDFSIDDVYNSYLEVHNQRKDFISCRLASTEGKGKIACDKYNYAEMMKAPLTELDKLDYYLRLGCKAGRVVEHAYNIAYDMVYELPENPSFKQRKKLTKAQQSFLKALYEYKEIKKKADKIIYKEHLVTNCLQQRLNI